jgi:trehalose-6-phosphate synthase
VWLVVRARVSAKKMLPANTPQQKNKTPRNPQQTTTAKKTKKTPKNPKKVMLGVDRLDMIKGIPQKLLAYEQFLTEHPEWRDKVLLVQVRACVWVGRFHG